MKVCKICNEVNSDNSPICKICSSREFKSYEEESKKSSDEILRRDKIIKFIEGGLIIFYVSVAITMISINYNNLSLENIISSIISAIVGIGLIKFTGLIFSIKHIFSLKDSSEDNMSDMYETYLKFGGVIALGASIWFLF